MRWLAGAVIVGALLIAVALEPRIVRLTPRVFLVTHPLFGFTEVCETTADLTEDAYPGGVPDGAYHVFRIECGGAQGADGAQAPSGR